MLDKMNIMGFSLNLQMDERYVATEAGAGVDAAGQHPFVGAAGVKKQVNQF